jgi:hypothetical protein
MSRLQETNPFRARRGIEECMPLAHSAGPEWLRNRLPERQSHGWLRSVAAWLTFWRRLPRAGKDDEGGPGLAGAGSTAPLIPRTPVLIGANTRRLEDAEG